VRTPRLARRVVPRLAEGPDADLSSTLSGWYRFAPYRHFRLLPKSAQTALVQRAIERILRTPDAFAVTGGKRHTAAVAIGRPLTWDSRYFGVPMGRLDYLIQAPDATRSDVRAALSLALDQFRALRIRHVAVKLDVEDGEALACLQEHGFRLMDSTLTYVAHPRRDAPRALRCLGQVRPFDVSDIEQILDITREAYAGYQGRFFRDHHLPRVRAEAFYVEWARQCCSGGMADRILVAEGTGGRLLGWASVKWADTEAVLGRSRISKGSLGACRPDVPGAYAGIIAELARDNHSAGALTEAQTQNTNVAMIRLLESLGAQYVRGDYDLHAWLD
jgi:hypothetical protein